LDAAGAGAACLAAATSAAGAVELIAEMLMVGLSSADPIGMRRRRGQGQEDEVSVRLRIVAGIQIPDVE
jgi:hypothetical protein